MKRRQTMLPYGRQSIESDDWQAVYGVLQSDWLTTGPLVEQFEKQFAATTHSEHAAAFNSGTAALHAAMQAAGVGPGDEVIVPALTFVATANAAVYLGATPVFADVSEETLLIDPADVAAKITQRTRAVVAVDYAGQLCDYETLRELTQPRGIVLIADACHSLGASRYGRPAGAWADLNCFSFHPVKPITTGEGGMVTSQSEAYATSLRRFRNHGIDTTHRERHLARTHRYDMVSLGFNYRMTDLQAALGLSQLKKLPRFSRRRQRLADRYDDWLRAVPHVQPLRRVEEGRHANHLYVVRWDRHLAGITRDAAFDSLQERGIGVNVHYLPVYMHSYYRRRFGFQAGICPRAERAYESLLSLPLFPAMKEYDVQRVVAELAQLVVIAEKAA